MTFTPPEINVSIDKFDTKGYENVANSFNEYNMAVSYIMNYMCQHMAPHLALAASSGKTFKSIQSSYDDFCEDVSVILETAMSGVENASSEDNIKSFVEADNLIGLKDQIDSIKDICINEMIRKRSLSDYNYYSFDGTSESLDLSSIYNTEIDEFIDDESNNFVKELKTSIKGFISERQALSSDVTALNTQTEREKSILDTIAGDAIEIYLKYHDSISDMSIFDSLKECSWESCGPVYDKDIKHDYYFVSVEDDSNAKEETPLTEIGYPEETTTSADMTKYNYWLRYMGVATLMNAATPQNWSTGFVGPNGPVKLPIIMIPFFATSGSMIVVMGLGICGMYPLPMFLFVNATNLPLSVVIPINMMIDMIKGKIKEFTSKSVDEIVKSAAAELTAVNADIKKCEDDISAISEEITKAMNLAKSKAAEQELDENKKRKSV